MRWRFTALALLILSVSAFRLIAGTTLRVLLPTRPPPRVLVAADAESMLAIGDKLPLRCVDMASLELIIGVSDRLATELLAKREEILSAAHMTSMHSALQLARGVGEKTATNLTRFLSPTSEQACPTATTSLIPFIPDLTIAKTRSSPPG
jgi:hypothetical protein